MPVQEVNRLLNQFEQMQKMMKQMQKGGMAKMMRGMKGMMPGGCADARPTRRPLKGLRTPEPARPAAEKPLPISC